MKKLIFNIFILILTGLSLSVIANNESSTDGGGTLGKAAQGMSNALQIAGQNISDAAITTKIYARYTADPLVDPFKIKVSTDNGKVLLSGNVDADAELERAMQLATTTDGVTEVNGKELKVKPSSQFFTDSFITLESKLKLFRSQYIEGVDFNTWNIHVETNNGIVYLIGNVRDEIIKAKIIDMVKSVNGVKKVKTDLSTEQ